MNRSLAYLWVGVLWAAMFAMIHFHSYREWSAPIRHRQVEAAELSRFRLLADNSFKGGYLP